eukprot:scaffold295546_cov23-Tisochrysis_lutea.AAC.1
MPEEAALCARRATYTQAARRSGAGALFGVGLLYQQFGDRQTHCLANEVGRCSCRNCPGRLSADNRFVPSQIYCKGDALPPIGRLVRRRDILAHAFPVAQDPICVDDEHRSVWRNVVVQGWHSGRGRFFATRRAGPVHSAVSRRARAAVMHPRAAAVRVHPRLQCQGNLIGSGCIPQPQPVLFARVL